MRTIEIRRPAAVAGSRLQVGQVVEVEDGLARSWIESGMAVEASAGTDPDVSVPGPEKAVRRPPERAVPKRSRRGA